jgi:hypothetical protein
MRRIASCGTIQIFARFIADAITTETLDGDWRKIAIAHDQQSKREIADYINDPLPVPLIPSL